MISSFSSIRFALVFSTFRILPRSGRIAWNFRSRPCFADPPADSPSTMKISLASRGSRSWQSASFPGSEVEASALLRRAMSRAFRAASRAWKESTTLETMALASPGFSSKKRTSSS